MSVRFMFINVLYGIIICLCYQVSFFRCQVTLVTRNVTDSFRIGDEGCKKNESVCTTEGSCQADGLCLCKSGSPHFRNPAIVLNGSSSIYDNSYGCLKQAFIRLSVDDSHCKFESYQLIPNRAGEPATKFIYKGSTQVESCTLTSTEVKFPNSSTKTKLPWLNASYVKLEIRSGTLHFQWKKSVPALQGLMIRITLRCWATTGQGTTYFNECIEAKVLGTWPFSDTVTTTPATKTIKPSTVSTLSTSIVSTTTSIVPTSKPSSSEKISGDEGGPNAGVIAVAVIVPLVLIVVIIVVVVWKKRNDDSNEGVFMHPAKKKTDLSSGSYHKKTPGYRVESTAHVNDALALSPSEYAAPNSQRVGVNDRDMHAVVSKDNEQPKPKPKESNEPKELNYMAPENLALDNVTRVNGQSTQPTEYAAIVGVLQVAKE